MFDEIRLATRRSRATLLQDAAGVTALIVLLYGALCLPGLG